MSPTVRSAIIWSVFGLAIVGMLYGLAKLGTQTAPNPGAGTALSKAVDANDRVKGKTEAPHTLVEYSDFQCPACKAYQPMLQQLMAENSDKVRLVYRHYPLRSIHPNAQAAAEAAEAANKQGKFWEMHDVLFNTQTDWSTLRDPKSKFEEYARSLGLNVDQFKADQDSKETSNKIDADYLSGTQSGVQGTPTFFLDGKLITSPQSYEELKALVNKQ